jgi:hypothetical protein
LAETRSGILGGASSAEAWADSSRAWAEHMPDTLPDSALKVTDVSGDHWSARWWAHQAASSVNSGTGGILIGDTPPADPGLGQLWWESDTGNLYVWYDDGNSTQWVQVASGEPGSGGGGGGIEEAPVDSQQYARQDADWSVVTGGDDLDTTPVAAIGSSVEQTLPEWLAGAPVIEAVDEIFISADHRGAWVHCMHAIATVIYLPGDWLPGWSFGARQIGTGPVNWVPIGGASMQVPFTKNEHTSILEQYEEMVFRVISNSDGEHAVWGFSGATI